MRIAVLMMMLFGFGGMVLAEDIITEEKRYKVGDQEFVGELAYDKSNKGKRPGVLVVHEWWGLNDYARSRAKQLAAAGYVAFAVDMYGDGKTAGHPKEAGEMSGVVMSNLDEAEKRFRAAMAVLSEFSLVDANKKAAIGYCFGGGIVLQMARRGLPLDVVASFHGMLGSGHRAAKGDIKGKVLVFNGADDGFIKPEEIAALKSEMKEANANFEFHNFEGAVHGFTVREATARGKKFEIPLAYNEAADKSSWQRTLQVFKETLK